MLILMLNPYTQNHTIMEGTSADVPVQACCSSHSKLDQAAHLLAVFQCVRRWRPYNLCAASSSIKNPQSHFFSLKFNFLYFTYCPFIIESHNHRTAWAMCRVANHIMPHSRQKRSFCSFKLKPEIEKNVLPFGNFY